MLSCWPIPLRLLKNKYFWLAIATLVTIPFCCLSPLKLLFDSNALTHHFTGLGQWSAGIFIGVYAIATLLGIPGTLLTIAGGAVFGLLWGTLCSLIGATLGAIGAFCTARYCLRNWSQQRFGQHKSLTRFNQAVTRKPLLFVLAIRFAPISPFNVVNFLFGLTPIDLKPYALGTFFGIIPGTLAYTWLGVTGEQALHGGNHLPFFLALSFLTALSLLPILSQRKRVNG